MDKDGAPKAKVTALHEQAREAVWSHTRDILK